MTPAEHRKHAEGFLSKLARGSLTAAEQDVCLRLAQVHATLAQVAAPAETPPEPTAPTVDTKRAVYVQTFTGELIELSKQKDGSLYLGCDTPDGDWSALITDPTQARLMADALTAHAQRMENAR